MSAGIRLSDNTVFLSLSPDYAWASTAGSTVLVYTYQKADRVDTQVPLWLSFPVSQ